MTRLSAGLITGLIGAVLLVGLDFAKIPFLPLIVPIAAGAVAGVLVARNPAYANKAGNGALAGLIGGAVFLAGSLIFGIIVANSDVGRSIVSVAEATATARAGTGGGSNVPLKTIVEVGIVVGTCFAGLLYMGLTVAAGAIAGAIAGRNSTPPPVQMAPQDRMWTPPPGYPPPGYPPPPPPPQGQPPYPSGQ